MSETYEAWKPMEDTPLPLSFNLESMNLCSNRLVLAFTSSLKNEFELVFEPTPISINVCNESFRLATFASLPKPRQGCIYIVNNSNLLSRFHAESLGIYSKDPIFHLAIVTDEWVDLLISDFPSVRQTKLTKIE